MERKRTVKTSDPQFDGCEVIQKLRSGPATDWYLARQRSLGRSVIIKALSPNVSPDSPFAAPLEREARLLGQMQHEHVVRLYDFVRRPSHMWLVLEYVDGWTLEELLQQAGRFSIPAALALTAQLVETLQYVHEQGIVHRDIQPKNLLVTKDGKLKLANFFLAAERSAPPPPELLEGDSGFSAPSYMSPELVLGELAEPSSDLFSVGVVLYELVTGTRPFDGSDSRTTAQRIRHEAPPPLSRFLETKAPVLERILLRALHKLPADRYRDARELHWVLDQALRSYGESTPRQWVVEALNEQGLLRAAQAKRPLPVVVQPAAHPVLRPFAVYAVALTVLMGGNWFIDHFAQSRRAEAAATPLYGLPLVPEQAGLLRAVARPWAHLFIDGQHVTTTPFAEPIPLAAGIHHVRFEHPRAPDEHREVNVQAGQHVFLDVEMRIPKAFPSEEDDLLRPPGDGGVVSP